ncbi:STAS domain-containing protein [Lentzea tibetensis]|uniref:STAS domain-containing protein n=1 Tax=Lentzea tibetensis TaxID=2591470 RepID=UPI001647ED2A|nr:STAS domain-containing protein [Lentzea tibetensis]
MVDAVEPPDDQVSLTADESRGATVVHVAGELDMVTAPQLEEYVRARIGGGAVVLDLAGVTFFGSAGVIALITLNSECARQRVAFRLSECSAAVRRTLELTGLDTYFRCAGDAETG